MCTMYHKNYVRLIIDKTMQKVIIYTAATLLIIGILVTGVLWLMTPSVPSTTPGTNIKPATSSGTGGQTTVTPGSGGRTTPPGQGIIVGAEGSGSIQVHDFK